IHTTDLDSETAFDVPPFIREIGVRALLAVPMLIDDRAIGALVLDSFSVREFSADEIRVAQAIANQTAVALERARLFADLRDSYDRTLDALAAALDARDKETEGHSRRVVAYTLALAGRINVPEDELVTIRRGALLHDIGKIGVPDTILLKPGPLTDEERAIMRRHPEWGQRILSGIRFLEDAVQIVCAHQERWDGAGYPRGLAGEAIPLGARIFAVADTFDAITSDRPYRAARPYAVARAEIEAGSGAQFDPRAVEAFREIPEEEWARLRAESLAAPVVPLPPRPEFASASPPELEAINRLIAAVSGSLQLDEILREAAGTTVEMLGAAACGLFLHDAETDSLSLAADYGLPESLKTRFSHFPVAGFHNEAVVREACARLHPDVSDVPAFVEIGLPASHPEWGAYLCVPLTAKGEVMGVMGCFSRRPRAFEAHDVTLYQAIGEQIGLAIGNARLHQSVQQLAITDGLTGAFNRRYLDEFLAKELQRCARYRHGVSLIMLDLDHFKDHNDRYGHPTGDEALRQLVELLRRNVRAVDVVARYGGEEFAIVLPETEADQALYNAKGNGRNCVCAWQPELADLPRQTTPEEAK
ncbi:MAG: diguanylate cyclase, partial [Chloroflexi bacterium]|nr:diguanylate cyclase [Chloroflexota bacterium]